MSRLTDLPCTGNHIRDGRFDFAYQQAKHIETEHPRENFNSDESEEEEEPPPPPPPPPPAKPAKSVAPPVVAAVSVAAPSLIPTQLLPKIPEVPMPAMPPIPVPVPEPEIRCARVRNQHNGPP